MFLQVATLIEPPLQELLKIQSNSTGFKKNFLYSCLKYNFLFFLKFSFKSFKIFLILLSLFNLKMLKQWQYL